MKVVIDTTAHPGGGSITYLENLLERFDETNDEYVVIVPAGRDALLDSGISNVSFVDARFPVENVVFREIYRQMILPLILLRSNADVLFSTGDITSLLAPIPTVVTVHNLAPYAHQFGVEVTGWGRLRNAIHRLLTKLSMQRATQAIFVSECMAKTVGGRTRRENTKVIHHGVDLSKFQISENLDIDDGLQATVDAAAPFILTVSTINPHKNYEVLLRGFAALPKESQAPHQVLIAGRHPDQSYYRRLQRIVEEEGIEDSVTFLGGVPRKFIPYLYANAKVFVLPSKVESFGMTVLEAMASATPVIASEAASIPEICGEAATFFDPDDAEALATTLQRVLSDPETRESLIEAGRQRIEKFTWDETAERTKAVLRAAAQES